MEEGEDDEDELQELWNNDLHDETLPQWQWRVSAEWRDYSHEASAFIEWAVSHGQKTCRFMEGGKANEIDLVEMRQNRRTVRRKPKPRPRAEESMEIELLPLMDADDFRTDQDGPDRMTPSLWPVDADSEHAWTQKGAHGHSRLSLTMTSRPSMITPTASTALRASRAHLRPERPPAPDLLERLSHPALLAIQEPSFDFSGASVSIAGYKSTWFKGMDSAGDSIMSLVDEYTSHFVQASTVLPVRGSPLHTVAAVMLAMYISHGCWSKKPSLATASKASRSGQSVSLELQPSLQREDSFGGIGSRVEGLDQGGSKGQDLRLNPYLRLREPPKEAPKEVKPSREERRNRRRGSRGSAAGRQHGMDTSERRKDKEMEATERKRAAYLESVLDLGQALQEARHGDASRVPEGKIKEKRRLSIIEAPLQAFQQQRHKQEAPVAKAAAAIQDDRNRRVNQISGLDGRRPSVALDGRRPSLAGGDPSARKGRRASQSQPRRASLMSDASMVSATWYNAGQGLEEDNLVQSKQQEKLQRRASRVSHVSNRPGAPMQRPAPAVPAEAGYRARFHPPLDAVMAVNKPSATRAAPACPVPPLLQLSSSAPALHSSSGAEPFDELGGIEGVLQGLKEEILQAQKARTAPTHGHGQDGRWWPEKLEFWMGSDTPATRAAALEVLKVWRSLHASYKDFRVRIERITALPAGASPLDRLVVLAETMRHVSRRSSQRACTELAQVCRPAGQQLKGKQTPQTIYLGQNISALDATMRFARRRISAAYVLPCSPHKVGGMFLSANWEAAEAEACLRSTLFAGMHEGAVQTRAMTNLATGGRHVTIPPDGAVLCPGVEVFRGAGPDFPPLSETIKLEAVIGVSLPNFRESVAEVHGAMFKEMALDRYIETMMKKWRAAFDCAIHTHVDRLVFTDSGCHDFQNSSRALGFSLGRAAFSHAAELPPVYIVGHPDFYTGVRDGLDPASRWSGKAIGSTGQARPSSQGSMLSGGRKGSTRGARFLA